MVVEENVKNTLIFNYDKLRSDIVQKRLVDNRMSMIEASEEMGISTMTLSRVERGNKFDIETFCAIAGWLENSPEVYFTNQKL